MPQTEADRALLADLGRRFPTKRVSDQTAYTAGIVEKYTATLLTSGATEEMIASLATKREKLSAALGVQQAAQTGVHAATRAEDETVTAAKGHVRKLSELVPMVINLNKLKDISPDEVLPKETLARSTSKLTHHLERTRPLIEKLNALLTPHFKNQSPLELQDKLIKDLSDLQKAQSSKQGTLPNETFEINVAKGELVQCIDNLNRIGRVAYIDQQVIARQFNKDILRRSRRGKRKGGDSADADEPEEPDAGDGTTDSGVTKPDKPTEPK